MHQDDSTSSSSSGEEVDTDAEETRLEGNKSRYKWPSSPGKKGKSPRLPREGE